MSSTAASNTLTGQGKQQPNVGRVNGAGAARSGLQKPTAQRMSASAPGREPLGHGIPTYKELQKKYQNNHE